LVKDRSWWVREPATTESEHPDPFDHPDELWVVLALPGGQRLVQDNLSVALRRVQR